MRQKAARIQILSFLVLLALLVPVGSFAFAEKPQYESTKDFIEYMESNDIKYNYKGISNSSSSERIVVIYTLDSGFDLEVTFLFFEDGEGVSIRCWNMAKVAARNLPDAYQVINQCNRSYKWVKFVLDTDDNTIQGECDACFRNRNVGEICGELLSHIVAVCQECYADIHALE